jgi:hypothetical protein
MGAFVSGIHSGQRFGGIKEDGRSLTGAISIRSLMLMCSLRILRQTLSLMLTLAFVLGGASQAFASTAMVPCAMSMSADDSMAMSAMSDPGMGNAEHGMPCPDSGIDCMGLAGCMTAPAIFSAEQGAIGVALPGDRFEISAMSGSSRSVRPALPPPIIPA